jgi:hypothetical protein
LDPSAALTRLNSKTRKRSPNGLKGLVLVAPASPVPTAAPKEQRDAIFESYQSPATVTSVLPLALICPTSEAKTEHA